MNSEDREIADKIAKHGWTAIRVDDSDPCFVYSIGLMYSAKHPEIIIFGLREQNYELLAAVIKLIRSGKSFARPGRYDDALGDVPLGVGAVHPSQHDRFLGFAMGFCRHQGEAGGLRVIQIFWPDRELRFPFEANCEPGVAIEQPLLHLPAGKEEWRPGR